jgi:hypothetical protein
MTAAERIAKIEERLDECAKGEWKACGAPGCVCGVVWSAKADLAVAIVQRDAIDGTWADDIVRGNMQLIANAPADMRWLLARLKRADELLRVARFGSLTEQWCEDAARHLAGEDDTHGA